MASLPRREPVPGPAERAYNHLIEAILDGTIPANSTLPAERELADRLGVTRPTLREALQRLDSNGWIKIRHGKPTRVRDIWTEGNLNVLEALVQRRAIPPQTLVPQLLEIRGALAPLYTASAVAHRAQEVAALLDDLLVRLEDTPESFARADWELHHRLTVLSGNPVYTLLLNGFAGFYEDMARLYFNLPQTRAYSRRFYTDLRAAAADRDSSAAGTIAAQVMAESIKFWDSAAQALERT